jgi:MtN3 and saliva related transmembrane protein
MKMDIMDPNISFTMNIFVIIANVINLIYNIPQVMKTYKTKSTKDFSTTFLLLRIIGNIIWTAYAIEVNSMLMLINNSITVIASTFIAYYKIIELHTIYINKKKVDDDEIELCTSQDDKYILDSHS